MEIIVHLLKVLITVSSVLLAGYCLLKLLLPLFILDRKITFLYSLFFPLSVST
jgi:hypothetical protein